MTSEPYFWENNPGEFHRQYGLLVMRTRSETRPPGGRPAVGSVSSASPVRGGANSAIGNSPGAEIGELFRGLRRCLKLSMPELARRLETRIEVIEALESGNVRRLPQWPETVRIVSAYTLLARIDPRPVLHLIGERITAEQATSPVAPAEPSSRRPVQSESGVRQRLAGLVSSAVGFGGHLQGLLGQSALMRSTPRKMRWAFAAVAVVLLSASLMPSKMLQASAGQGSVAGVFGGIAKFVGLGKTMRRDGLTWIEVDDPRSRRADKLRSNSR